jgi:hypothetical protein
MCKYPYIKDNAVNFDDTPFFVNTSKMDVDVSGGKYVKASDDLYYKLPHEKGLFHKRNWGSGWLFISKRSSILGFKPNIEELLEPKTPWGEVDEYNLPFQNYGKALLQGLASKVAGRISTIRSFKHAYREKAYAPLVHLTNSSGTGKTRSAMELGKLTNVILIKFSGQNGIPISLFGVALKKFMKLNFYGRQYKKCLLCMNVILHRLIHACSHISDGRREHLIADNALKAFLGEDSDKFVALFEERFFAGLNDFLSNPSISIEDANIQGGDLLGFQDDWIPVWCAMSTSQLVEQNRRFIQSRKDIIVRGLETSSGELQVASCLPPLIIVLDEAFDLMEDSNPESKLILKEGSETIKTDMYRVFRRTVRSFGFWWKISLTITISTDSHISKFYPAPTDDPSFRSGGVVVEWNI